LSERNFKFEDLQGYWQTKQVEARRQTFITEGRFCTVAQNANEEISKNPENIDFCRAKVRMAEFYFDMSFRESGPSLKR